MHGQLNRCVEYHFRPEIKIFSVCLVAYVISKIRKLRHFTTVLPYIRLYGHILALKSVVSLPLHLRITLICYNYFYDSLVMFIRNPKYLWVFFFKQQENMHGEKSG